MLILALFKTENGSKLIYSSMDKLFMCTHREKYTCKEFVIFNVEIFNVFNVCQFECRNLRTLS